MNITIIGGSGFVGTRLIELLQCQEDVYSCKNVDIQPSHFFGRITTIGDVRNQKEMDVALNNSDVVILLAAQHRDDVTPVSLYYDTNVKGMEITLTAMEKNGCKRIIFFSSVAIYGLNKNNPNESHIADPFNHYGKSKWQAEQILQKWYETHPDWNVNIVRPTVIFGERNRGNVYNLLKQISSGKFLMVGDGKNKKSMAYIGNVVTFVKFLIDNIKNGYNVFNYVDKPDNNMNELVEQISIVLNRNIPSIHIPYWLGMIGGYFFDIFSKLTGKKTSISSVRVKKFCANTQFDASKVEKIKFKAPYTLNMGLAQTIDYEFQSNKRDNITYITE